MTLQQLKYLVTVAECRNITEAAEKLFISQPSLSAAIHNLESEMGVTAFVRTQFARTGGDYEGSFLCRRKAQP